MTAQQSKTVTLFEVYEEGEIVLVTDDYYKARDRFANGGDRIAERDYEPVSEPATIKEAS